MEDNQFKGIGYFPKQRLFQNQNLKNQTLMGSQPQSQSNQKDSSQNVPVQNHSVTEIKKTQQIPPITLDNQNPKQTQSQSPGLPQSQVVAPTVVWRIRPKMNQAELCKQKLMRLEREQKQCLDLGEQLESMEREGANQMRVLGNQSQFADYFWWYDQLLKQLNLFASHYAKQWPEHYNQKQIVSLLEAGEVEMKTEFRMRKETFQSICYTKFYCTHCQEFQLIVRVGVCQFYRAVQEARTWEQPSTFSIIPKNSSESSVESSGPIQLSYFEMDDETFCSILVAVLNTLFNQEKNSEFLTALVGFVQANLKGDSGPTKAKAIAGAFKDIPGACSILNLFGQMGGGKEKMTNCRGIEGKNGLSSERFQLGCLILSRFIEGS